MLTRALPVASLTIEELRLTLREPFQTSFGTEKRREFLLVQIESRTGLSGWGECVAARDPLYSEESVATASWIIRERFVPLLRRRGPISVREFHEAVRPFRGNRMAKAAVEAALLDVASREARIPLGAALGQPVRRRIPVGVSVGIHPDPSALVARVGRYVEEGYARIKLKVTPGRDQKYVAAIRRAYPLVELWVDANRAYRPEEGRALRTWAGRFHVAQVEQPFGDRALRAHARLQAGAPFRVCLDESVVDEESLSEAIGMRALRSLNVKPGRVGGLVPAVTLARTARTAGSASWVGGMLESGIGRANNLHLASLEPFTLSSDLSASSRYYREDLIASPFVLGAESTVEVPKGPGNGVTLDERVHRRALRRRHRFGVGPR